MQFHIDWKQMNQFKTEQEEREGHRMQEIDMEIQQICKEFINDFDSSDRPYETVCIPASENADRLVSAYMKTLKTSNLSRDEVVEAAFVAVVRELANGTITFTDLF